MRTSSIHTSGTASRRTYCRAHLARGVLVRPVPAVAESLPRTRRRGTPFLLGLVSWALLSAGTIVAVGALA